MLTTPFARFRLMGFVEGISFLLLLGIAMPLKYMADWPVGVTVVGWIHGILFILYFLTLAHVWYANRWPFPWVVGAVLASIIPFGPFLLDRQIPSHYRSR